MLRVTTIHASTAGASARYYTEYLADDGPDGEGHWVGRQAAELGMAGRVDRGDLEALLSGRDPTTETRLGSALVDRADARGHLIRAVAGFDATFSAPKSLSAWWGLTGDPGLLAAHDVAVQAVLDHLERYGATTRIRVNGRRLHPDTEGLTMAAFRQHTSREDDPQIHTHVVISAKVQTADGRWFALDARYLKRKQRALGGLYQSVLRAELMHRYGVAWDTIVNGQAEIAGMPADLLGAFSKRAAQVEASLAAKISEFRSQEGRDPSTAERAGLARDAARDSRQDKTHVGTEALRRRWKGEADTAGWNARRLRAAFDDASRAAHPAGLTTIADVTEHLSTNGSTWTRADVVQAICDRVAPESQLSGRDWASAIEQACDRVVARCVDLDPASGPHERRTSDGRSEWLAPIDAHLTVQEILDQEERILSFASGATHAAESPSHTVDRTEIDLLQAEAAAAAAGQDEFVLVVGPAGTGKTTTMRRAVDDLRRQSRPVFGVTPTAKAAKVLRDETGMPPDTLAKLLHEWRAGDPSPAYRLPRGSTVVLDEAGMTGTGALDRLVGLAVSQGWRLVLVGDPRQLQAVGRGGMFDELCRSFRTHELAMIHRFRCEWERAASLQLRSGSPKALDAYFDHDRVFDGSFEDLVAVAATRWIEETSHGRSVAVVAETNAHVDQLNLAIQRERQADGALGPAGARVAGGETAFVGDIVVTRRNQRALRTDRGEPVRNRDRWSVVGVAPTGVLTLSHLGGHGRVTVPADYAHADVRLGYAATAHGHQGDTVDASLTIVTEATSLRSLYVGATRGRDRNDLLVVTGEDGDPRDVLERVLTNEHPDLPAVAQRRQLAADAPPSLSPRAALRAAQASLQVARRDAEPFVAQLTHAREERDAKAATIHAAESDLQRARRGRRQRQAAVRVGEAAGELAIAAMVMDGAEAAAAAPLARVADAEAAVRRAERSVSLHIRLQQAIEAPTRTTSRDADLDLGLSL
jgi:conjugative relaxase-like TrwC/TraI family protein